MCTLTAVRLGPHHAGNDIPQFRVVVNRDEQRTRADALPPSLCHASNVDALFPVDPTSRGTWVGVNTAGLVLAVLNSNPLHKVGKRPDLASRGQIVPALLSCEDVSAAVTRARDLDAGRFPPFRLVAIERERVAIVAGDGAAINVQSIRRFDEPVFATSSGLGDHIVEMPRRELFRSMLGRGASNLRDRQDEFHRHWWPDRRPISVEMSRADARTVSRTVIEVFADAICLSYIALLEIDPLHCMAGYETQSQVPRAGAAYRPDAALPRPPGASA